MEPGDVERRILEALPDADMEVEGADCNFTVTVVSPSFEGVGALARQRTVLGLFARELATGSLHALSVKARTPAELSASRRHFVQIDDPGASKSS